jgi:hypothetical protein
MSVVQLASKSNPVTGKKTITIHAKIFLNVFIVQGV